MTLADKRCVPCRGGVPPLDAEGIAPLLAQLQGWEVVDGHHLTKTYTFDDFARALAFVNRVGDVAEEQGHHPDLHLSWGRVVVDVWTHKIDGLTESDFVLAAKVDREHHPEPERRERVWRAEDPAHAHLLAGLLESHGIAATVHGESRFAGAGSLVPADALPTIWVAATDAARARELLKRHHDSDTQSPA